MNTVQFLIDLIRTSLASVAIILSASFFQSCSVKEDRSDCPSHLSVDLKGCALRSALILISGEEGEAIASDAISPETVPEGNIRRIYRYRVPKGKVRVSSFSKGESLLQEGNTLSIAPESQMDSLWGESREVIVSHETEYYKPIFHKQFATIDLILARNDSSYGEGPFSDRSGGVPLPLGKKVSARIGVRGVNLTDLSPSIGEAVFDVPFSEERGAYTFRLPRMKEEGVMISIREEGKEIRSLDVGKILLEAGFDWEEEDLSDAIIVADRYEGEFTVSISSWGKRTVEVVL